MCGLLVLLFAWLKIKSIQIAQIFEHAEPALLLKISVIAFYISWTFGPDFDIKVQKLVYVTDPHGGKLAPSAYLLVLAFSVNAAFMIWASDKYQGLFFVALNAFIVINIAGYAVTYRRMEPAAKASRKLFLENKDYFGFLQLSVVKEYIFGKWQLYRFIFVVFGVCLLDAIYFSSQLKILIAEAIYTIFPELSLQAASQLLPVVALFFFFLVSEGWIWIKRLIVEVSLRRVTESTKSLISSRACLYRTSWPCEA
jgi:hypothetical protein